MSAILREALVQDETTEEPKTLLEIGVPVKRPITTRTTIITPTPIISHSQHLLHHLTSAPAPPTSASSHLQHHLSSQFTPIHQVHRPTSFHPHHPWNESTTELVSPPAYPLHSYPTSHSIVHHHSNRSNNNNNGSHLMPSHGHEILASQVNHNDGHRYAGTGEVENKIARMSNTSWKDRAIQIERGNVCCVKKFVFCVIHIMCKPYGMTLYIDIFTNWLISAFFKQTTLNTYLLVIVFRFG